MQNKEAALIKVAGTTIHWQSSQSMIGSVKCQRTRNLEVKRVYDSGMGIPMSCSQTPIPSWKQVIFDSCFIIMEGKHQINIYTRQVTKHA